MTESRIDTMLKWVNGPDVLDIGSAGHIPRPGSRHWVFGRLNEAFPETIGLDYNVENVDLLRGRGFANLQVGNAEDFTFPRKFDTVTAGELIEHLNNPGRFLSCARNHLKEGGRLVITTPYVFGLLNVVYGWLRFPTTCINPEHAVWFCPSTIIELARREGFFVEHWQLLVDLPDNPNPPVLPKKVIVGIYRLLQGVFPRRLVSNGMLFVFKAGPPGVDESG